MKFLLNMNMPRQLGKRLIEIGHECRHVGNIGMAQAKDIEIVEEASSRHEVILTHDLDYGRLLSFSDKPTTSVVIFRLRNTHPENLFARITGSWNEIESHALSGAIIVIEDDAIRIRKLTIAEE